MAKTQSPISDLLSVADVLVKRSIWSVGGDGWDYGIGYGGLDHVMASGRNVNLLVLDTEVYSNTGGQASKSTPRAAVAKFASGGKLMPKKDLGLLAISYDNVYVARIAMGANDAQTVKAFVEAEAYPGPSLIIAYSHCIAHSYDLRNGLEQQKKATQSGYWPLYRYNPTLAEAGQNPFILDSKPPSITLDKYAYNETRYRMLTQTNEAEAERLMKLAQEDVLKRWRQYEQLAAAIPAEKQLGDVSCLTFPLLISVFNLIIRWCLPPRPCQRVSTISNAWKRPGQARWYYIHFSRNRSTMKVVN
jgi:pyruvate-ferredoxin/flavodoxin oxidoreductase